MTPSWLAISKAIGHRISIIWQIAKFIDIGILNTLVDWGTLILLMFSFRNYIKIEPIGACFSIRAIFREGPGIMN